MIKKRTLILGASPNHDRYSHKATLKLKENNHPIFPVGIRKGEIDNVSIIVNKNIIEAIDTITFYVGAKNQIDWYNYILSTNPQRIIFNPGTENQELVDLANKNGIKTEIACTLVLLSLKEY